MRELNITTREEGQRLDKILSKYLNKAPKSFAKNIELFLKMKTHTYLQKATLTLWLL